MGEGGETFGQMVRRLRKRRGWSQEMLGRHADGLDQATVSLVEHDKGRPSLDTVTRLASAFGADPQEWTYLAGLMPRPGLAAESPGPQAGDEYDDVAALPLAEVIAHVKNKPGEKWRAQVARTEARLGPEKFAKWCREIMRAWSSNGQLAASALDLTEDRG